MGKCSYCGGHGVKDDELCIHCKATGEVDWIDDIGGVYLDQFKASMIRRYRNPSTAYYLRRYWQLSIEAKELLEGVVLQEVTWACYLIVYCDDLCKGTREETIRRVIEKFNINCVNYLLTNDKYLTSKERILLWEVAKYYETI